MFKFVSGFFLRRWVRETWNDRKAGRNMCIVDMEQHFQAQYLHLRQHTLHICQQFVIMTPLA